MLHIVYSRWSLHCFRSMTRRYVALKAGQRNNSFHQTLERPFAMQQECKGLRGSDAFVRFLMNTLH